MFRSAVLQILCGILSALQGNGAEATIIPLVQKAFGFFTNAYQATGFTDADNVIKFLRITNDSDGTYMVSLNNSTNGFFIPAYSVKDYPFSETGVQATLTTDVYMKYVTAPTIGNVFLEGWH